MLECKGHWTCANTGQLLHNSFYFVLQTGTFVEDAEFWTIQKSRGWPNQAELVTSALSKHNSCELLLRWMSWMVVVCARRELRSDHSLANNGCKLVLLTFAVPHLFVIGEAHRELWLMKVPLVWQSTVWYITARSILVEIFTMQPIIGQQLLLCMATSSFLTWAQLLTQNQSDRK